MQNTRIEIFIYHDAKMAEVKKFNGKKQFWLRNKYPNKNMLSRDEKFQWNYFLEEFLTHTKNSWSYYSQKCIKVVHLHLISTFSL